MRVGVSGAHGTGKTTLVEELCAHLAGHVPVDEPYFLLEEGYEFEFPPSLDDYRAQLGGRCARWARPHPGSFSTGPRWIFWPTLRAGRRIESEATTRALALASLDLLIVTPVR